MNQTIKRAALWIAALLLLTWAVVLRLDAGRETVEAQASSDFYKFYLSARRAEEGKSIYWVIPPKIRPGDPCDPDTVRERGQPPGIGEDRLTLGGPIPCLAPNLNPPFFVLALTPITSLPYEQAWWTWAALSTFATVYSLWLISGSFPLTRHQRHLLAAWLTALMFMYYPHFADFTLGQVGSILLLLLTLAWLSMRKGCDAPAGAWLGLATGLKPFLLVLVIPLAAQRRWQTIAWLGATTLTTLLVGLTWYGWETYADYGEIAGHVTWTASNWNASIVGLVNRAFSATDFIQSPKKNIIKAALVFAPCAITVLLSTLMCMHTREAGRERRADHFAIQAIPMTLLVSPLAWLYYLPWLCIPIAALWHLCNGHRASRVIKLALCATLTVTLSPVPMKPIPTPRNPTVWWGGDSLYFYALMGASVVLTVSAWILAQASHIRQHAQDSD